MIPLQNTNPNFVFSNIRSFILLSYHTLYTYLIITTKLNSYSTISRMYLLSMIFKANEIYKHFFYNSQLISSMVGPPK